MSTGKACVKLSYHGDLADYQDGCLISSYLTDTKFGFMTLIADIIFEYNYWGGNIYRLMAALSESDNRPQNYQLLDQNCLSPNTTHSVSYFKDNYFGLEKNIIIEFDMSREQFEKFINDLPNKKKENMDGALSSIKSHINKVHIEYKKNGENTWTRLPAVEYHHGLAKLGNFAHCATSNEEKLGHHHHFKFGHGS